MFILSMIETTSYNQARGTCLNHTDKMNNTFTRLIARLQERVSFKHVLVLV